jgi:hypothetical protein
MDHRKNLLFRPENAWLTPARFTIPGFLPSFSHSVTQSFNLSVIPSFNP